MRIKKTNITEEIEPQESEQVDERVVPIAQYEKVLNELFRELNLKASHILLIRGFVSFAEGRTNFEASNFELANTLFKAESKGSRKNIDKLRNALKGLVEWQEANKVELIRIVQKGQRLTKDDGTYEYTKTKYEFVLLNNLVGVIHTASNSDDLEKAVEDFLKLYREQYKPTKKAKSYSPKDFLKRAKQTVLTKINRVFDLAIEATLDPEKECQDLLDESKKEVAELGKQWKVAKNRDAFIKGFESMIEDDEDDNKSQTVAA